MFQALLSEVENGVRPGLLVVLTPQSSGFRSRQDRVRGRFSQHMQDNIPKHQLGHIETP